jgi:hypothetical protein
MALPAAESSAMRAPMPLPVGMAEIHQPPLRSPRVDRAEGGGGEGDEQPWRASHRLGHALAAAQPGGEELELVALIGR